MEKKTMANENAKNRYELNKELAQMLKGGVIMDVTTPEQARKSFMMMLTQSS